MQDDVNIEYAGICYSNKGKLFLCLTNYALRHEDV
jgi:hypothetical protein